MKACELDHTQSDIETKHIHKRETSKVSSKIDIFLQQ